MEIICERVINRLFGDISEIWEILWEGVKVRDADGEVWNVLLYDVNVEVVWSYLAMYA